MVDFVGALECQTPAPTPIPQTPLQPQTPSQTPGTVETYNIPTGASDDSAGGNAGANTDLKPGRPSPYMVKHFILHV